MGRHGSVRVLQAFIAAAFIWYLTPPAGAQAPDAIITAADCTAAKLGTAIAPAAIGEPVRAVTLAEPIWVEAASNVPAHCRVNGSMAPVSTGSGARVINFGVVLPASWSRRSAQLGGGGMNGVVPNLTGGAPPRRGPNDAWWPESLP